MLKLKVNKSHEKENTMSKNLKTEAVDHLFDAILCLKDRAECYTFLRMFVL